MAKGDRGIAIETFKLLSNISPISNDMLQLHGHDYETRGRSTGNLSHVKPRGDVRKFSFAARAPIIWDKVTPEAKSANSTNEFKSILDSTTERALVIGHRPTDF